MPSLSLPGRAGGAARRRRGGFGGTLVAFFALAVLAAVLAAVVTASRREPEITQPKATEIAPQLDRIRPGASDRDVREAFGPPNAVVRNAPGSDYCLRYENLPSVQPAYRFCFEGGKLELISAQ